MLLAREHVTLTPDIISFAQILWQNGIGTYDALHYASALSAGATFLTVDDALIKKIMGLPGDPNMYSIQSRVLVYGA